MKSLNFYTCIQLANRISFLDIGQITSLTLGLDSSRGESFWHKLNKSNNNFVTAGFLIYLFNLFLYTSYCFYYLTNKLY